MNVLEIINAMLNYGCTITDDKELVRDTLMDLLIGLWEKRVSLPPVENVRSYLLTSFRRAILNALASDKRRTAKQHDAQALSEKHNGREVFSASSSWRLR